MKILFKLFGISLVCAIYQARYVQANNGISFRYNIITGTLAVIRQNTDYDSGDYQGTHMIDMIPNEIQTLSGDSGEDGTMSFIEPDGQYTLSDEAGLGGLDNLNFGASTSGPWAGATWASLSGNPNALAIYDDRILMLDPDNSLSGFAWYGGALQDWTWTSFGNGVFAGDTIVSRLPQLVGVEDLRMTFLEADGSFVNYWAHLGTQAENPTVTTITNGVLQGRTWANALNGGQFFFNGQVYDFQPAGITHGNRLNFYAQAVPEPSSVAMIVGSLSLLIARRRRRISKV